MKEPLFGGDVLALSGAQQLIELFVADVGEYRNTPERGSRVIRTPLLFSAHEVSLIVCIAVLWPSVRGPIRLPNASAGTSTGAQAGLLNACLFLRGAP
jgi:hypothetical protein